jgi:hypothetical protein
MLFKTLLFVYVDACFLNSNALIIQNKTAENLPVSKI